jgi:antirestriction protein ArdC
MQRDALDRAEHGRTCGNDLLIITAFAARGIDASPRVDCFTFNAWKALHRHVRKGEHGVHVPVYVTVTDQDKNDPEKIHVHKVPTGATVFHVSQTDPDGDKPAIVIVDPLTGATLHRVLIADVASQDDRPTLF